MKLAYPIATPEVRTKIPGMTGEPNQVLAELKAMGYQGVEPFMRDPAAFDVPAFCRALERHGLEIAAVGTGPMVAEDKFSLCSFDEQVRAAAVARVKAVVDFAAIFRSHVVIGKLRGDLAASDRARSLALMKSSLQELCDYAAPKGVDITIEPQSRFTVNNLNTVRQMRDFLCELDRPNAYLMCDLFHMNIEEASMEACLVEAGERMRYVHFTDNQRGVPGSGHLDFIGTLRVLRALGYQGWISVEIDQLPDAHTAAKASAEFLRPLLAGI